MNRRFYREITTFFGKYTFNIHFFFLNVHFFFVQKQISEKCFQILCCFVNTFLQVRIVCTDKCISEIPRIFCKNIISCRKPKFGFLDINLRVKTRRISKKDSVKYKKREDRKFLIGRTYNDFVSYTDDNDNVSIVEMDTVYNGQSGPFMQTFKFLSYSFMFIIYHEEKTAKVMVEGVDLLESILGKELFLKEVEIIKTDRGSEFSDAEGLEKDNDGSMRTHVFYCDPMASCQKGSLENNHKEIRYICPKETNLKVLGLDSQEKANLMVSHINSQPKENLKGKSPLERWSSLILIYTRNS